MAVPPSAAQRSELARLARELGEPLRVRSVLPEGLRDPIRKPDRIGEVCMVIRRPSGSLLLSIKTTYPRGAHRLPTGGIAPDEPILAALLRETREETGLEVAVRRFLASIEYVPPSGGPVAFRTYAFLLDELGGALTVLDPDEDIEEYIEVRPADLAAVADRLEGLPDHEDELVRGQRWAEWGRFRAVVHRAVRDALAGNEPRPAAAPADGSP